MAWCSRWSRTRTRISVALRYTSRFFSRAALQLDSGKPEVYGVWNHVVDAIGCIFLFGSAAVVPFPGISCFPPPPPAPRLRFFACFPSCVGSSCFSCFSCFSALQAPSCLHACISASPPPGPPPPQPSPVSAFLQTRFHSADFAVHEPFSDCTDPQQSCLSFSSCLR